MEDISHQRTVGYQLLMTKMLVQFQWSNGTHTAALRIASVVVLSLMSIVGCVGHLLLIFTLYKTSHFKHRCRCLLINISVLSLLCDSVNLPFYIVNIGAGSQVYTDASCKAIAYFSSFFFVALLANCLTVAFDRYQATAIVKRSTNQRRNHYLIALLWFVPAAAALAGLPFLGYNENQLHCIYEETSGVDWYSKILVALPTTATLIIISACYVHICHRVVRSRNNMLHFRQKALNNISPSPVPSERKMSTSVPNLRAGSRVMLADLRHTSFSQSMNNIRERIVAWSDTHERELRLTLQLLVNFTVFVALWLPLTVLYFLEGFTYISPNVWLSCAVIARMFTAINWAMYGLWNKAVRQSCLGNINKIFVCCFKSHAAKRKNRVESIRIIQEQFKREVKRFSQTSQIRHSASQRPTQELTSVPTLPQ